MRRAAAGLPARPCSGLDDRLGALPVDGPPPHGRLDLGAERLLAEGAEQRDLELRVGAGPPGAFLLDNGSDALAKELAQVGGRRRVSYADAHRPNSGGS